MILTEEVEMRESSFVVFITGLFLLAVFPALAQTPNSDREAYFGETHVHTGWSLVENECGSGTVST